jgi:hypothetical protein
MWKVENDLCCMKKYDNEKMHSIFGVWIIFNEQYLSKNESYTLEKMNTHYYLLL